MGYKNICQDSKTKKTTQQLLYQLQLGKRQFRQGEMVTTSPPTHGLKKPSDTKKEKD